MFRQPVVALRAMPGTASPKVRFHVAVPREARRANRGGRYWVRTNDLVDVNDAL